MDVSRLEGGYLLWGREVTEFDRDIRMSLGERPDYFRTADEVSPERAAHEQLTDFTAARALRHPGGLLRLRDDRFRFPEKHSAGVRQLHVTLRSVKEGRLDLRLETPDLLAQGRLGNMESGSCPSKMQLFGDRDEIAQVA
jgi:hypothetical protein